jgi:hypothetical protein
MMRTAIPPLLLLGAVVLAGSPSAQNPAARGAAAATAGLGAEPTVRIGIALDAPSVTVRSDQPFSVEGQRTRSVKVSTAVAVAASVTGPIPKADLQSRVLAVLEDGRVLVLDKSAKIRIEPGAARLEANGKSYRGIVEINASGACLRIYRAYRNRRR